jgi:hypothetical protein
MHRVQDDHRDPGGREHTALPLHAHVHSSPHTLHSDQIERLGYDREPSHCLDRQHDL